MTKIQEITATAGSRKGGTRYKQEPITQIQDARWGICKSLKGKGDGRGEGIWAFGISDLGVIGEEEIGCEERIMNYERRGRGEWDSSLGVESFGLLIEERDGLPWFGADEIFGYFWVLPVEDEYMSGVIWGAVFVDTRVPFERDGTI